MTSLRIMVATSGLISAARLCREISEQPELTLIGHAPDLSQAYLLAEGAEPDIALIGAELRRHEEFDGLTSLFRVLGTAWLEVETGHRGHASAATGHGPNGQHSARIRTGMAPVQFLKLLRQAHAGRHSPPGRNLRHVVPGHMQPEAGHAYDPAKLVLIGASTGGIDALLTILSRFPADCPPTAIVQHTGAAFSDSLIRLFARCTAARVLPAAAGIALQPGTIVVGAGCPGHLQILPSGPLQSRLVRGPPITGHIPSVDALFRSAVPLGRNVVAALLTGMGRDGAQGLLELRQGGASTIAQDEATAVVYGMPKAAVDLGAAECSLPLAQIAGALLGRCQLQQSSASLSRQA